MNKDLTYLCAVLLLLLSSCEPEEFATQSTTARSTAFEVRNSRLAFDSPENLAAFIEQEKKLGFEHLKTTLSTGLEKQFTSLLPAFTKNDLEKVATYKSFRLRQSDALKERLIRKFPTLQENLQVNEEVDLENDELIADQFFAALLNRDREIIVAGKIYKYTEDGIFYADEKKYDVLS